MDDNIILLALLGGVGIYILWNNKSSNELMKTVKFVGPLNTEAPSVAVSSSLAPDSRTNATTSPDKAPAGDTFSQPPVSRVETTIPNFGRKGFYINEEVMGYRAI